MLMLVLVLKDIFVQSPINGRSRASCVPDNSADAGAREQDHYGSGERAEVVDVVLSLGDTPSDRRRAELVAVFSCFLVCSCMMLGGVSTRSGTGAWDADIPSVDGHGLAWVVQVEVVGKVVLGSHGFGEVVGDVDASSGHGMWTGRAEVARWRRGRCGRCGRCGRWMQVRWRSGWMWMGVEGMRRRGSAI
jgi:hypothetical protein